MAVGQHVHLGQFDGGAQWDGALDVVVVGNAANQHDVTHDSAVLAGGEHRAVGIGEIVAEAVCERFSSMNATMFSGVTDGGQASGKVRAATSASSDRSASTAVATSMATALR